MSRSFLIRLFNQHQLSDPEVLQRVWRHLDSPLIKPAKFDSVEDAQRDWRTDAVSEAAELFDRELHLFVAGTEDAFVAVVSRPRRNLSLWEFRLEAGAMQEERGERWLTWLFELCGDLPVLYGSGCTQDEFDAKHATSRALEGGGHATGAKGMSIRNFFNFLPGVYWLTIFGPELVRAFGAERIEGLPGVRTERIGEDQIAVILDEPPVPEDMDARLRREAELAEALGAEFFFDRERDPAELRQVPELSEALEDSDG
jgi:hypothetical protein